MANGRIVINIEKCKGCELCIDACPENVIQLSLKSNKLGVQYAEFDNNGKCTSCKACALMCPECAIIVFRFSKKEK